MFTIAMLETAQPLIQYAVIFTSSTLITSLLIASLISSLAATGFSVYSQRQGARAAEEAAKRQRRYFEGLKDAENRRFEILKARQLSRARALFAKGGVVPSLGTPLEVMGLQALEIERSRRMAEWSIMSTGSAAEFSASATADRLRMGAVASGFQGGAQIFQTAAIHFGPSASSPQVPFEPLSHQPNLPAEPSPPRIVVE
jgi:hypothetical protein